VKILRLFSWPIIIITIAVAIFFGIHIFDLEISGGIAEFIPKDHPSSRADEAIREYFGPGKRLTIMMSVNDRSFFTVSDIRVISMVTEKIEQLPQVKDVLSVANAQYIKGEQGGFRSGEVMERLPQNDKDIDRIKEALYTSELYRNVLYSDDLRATQIIVTLFDEKATDSDMEYSGTASGIESSGTKSAKYDHLSALREIRNIIKEHEDKRRHFYIAGNAVIELMLLTGIRADLVILFPILIIILLFILFIAFKRISGMLLPLLTVLISCCWTIGLMALFHVKFTIMGTTIPILLIAVGSAYGIHLLTHYYEKLLQRHGGVPSKNERISHIYQAIKKVGKPILLAGLTTVAGFGSLAVSSITAIRDMGIFTAVGVAFAFIITLTFIPAMISIIPIKARWVTWTGKWNVSTSRLFTALYRFFANRKARIAILLFLLLFGSAAGIMQIRIGQPTINFFKESSDIRKADDFANQHLSGTTVLEIMVSRTNSPGATYNNITNDADTDSFDAENLMDTDFEEIAETEKAGSEFTAGELMDMDFEEIGDTETGEGGGEQPPDAPLLTDPEILKTLDDMKDLLHFTYPSIGKIASFADMVKDMNKAMHTDTLTAEDSLDSGRLGRIVSDVIRKSETRSITGDELAQRLLEEINFGGSAFNEIPYDPQKYGLTTREDLRRLISQYLFLYSGNLSDLIDDSDSPSRALITFQIRENDPSRIKQIKESIHGFAEERLKPLGWDLRIAGPGEKFLAMNELIVDSQLITITIALVVVFFILFISYRSAVAGLIGIIPIAFALLVNFAIMGFLGIPLDIVTALIASVAIGIGIDYSIHIMSSIKHGLSSGKKMEAAAEETINMTGRAIVYNALSVAAGFASLIFSLFVPLNNAGLLICITMFSSSFLSLTLLPAILTHIHPRFLLRQAVVQPERKLRPEPSVLKGAPGKIYS
jgi:predicted RND superfamily exporter protein